MSGESNTPSVPFEAIRRCLRNPVIPNIYDAEARAALDQIENLLVRLRQWDMLVGGIGADGEHHEATADAPYWRSEIDKVLGV